jgi:drug/metabolite transporter (DMT)-like permease
MLRGVALKVAATLAFAAMSALIKAALTRFPVSEVVLFRSLFALFVLVGWLASRGEFPGVLHTRRPLGHIGRSLAGSVAMFATFIVLALLPLADATAFTFATPLIVVPMAAFALGEIVRPYRWAGVGLGFLGVLVMLSDHLGEGLGEPAPHRKLGVAMALGGAVGAAVATIQTRRLTHSEPTGAIVFYFSSVTAILSGGLLLAAALWPATAPGRAFAAGQAFVAPNSREVVILAAIGLLGGAGQILMTHSYRFADASIIAAFDYVAMIWAAGLGFIFFDETPTPRILLGAALVAAAGIFVLWREQSIRRIRPLLVASAREVANTTRL